jgi:hypothetical protein
MRKSTAYFSRFLRDGIPQRDAIPRAYEPARISSSSSEASMLPLNWPAIWQIRCALLKQSGVALPPRQRPI